MARSSHDRHMIARLRGQLQASRRLVQMLGEEDSR
jgi:hypothetical protein